MTTNLEITMNKQGRVTIPSKLRKELKLQPDKPLIVRIENNKLIIQDRNAAIDEMMAFFDEQNKLHKPKGLAMVDEFIAERRLDAMKE